MTPNQSLQPTALWRLRVDVDLDKCILVVAQPRSQ